ncbi:glutamate 5-kinase [Marinicrinis sediminis]|uniref:Glutamate 5-kinase n=1 Tax=Marinicrinis sediminis TaxID=1652465 RepID=A0ABW5RDB2_9BACL
MQRRIVVKIGSSSLTSEEGGLKIEQIQYFVKEIASLHAEGNQVLFVSSGAVAAGFRIAGFAKRPQHLHEKQASAAVGQALLMQSYNAAFNQYGIHTAQILLTRADFSLRKRIHNALMTIEELLKHGIVPIINENDTVAVDELKFGDNDTLSALVANMVKAQQLMIFTDTDGLYTADPRTDKAATRIGQVSAISKEIYQIAGGAGSSVGTGGMRSKIDAARIAMRGGIKVFVGRATEPGDLRLAEQGQGKGTYFETQLTSLPMKKQWLAFHSQPQGTIIVDTGARNALVQDRRSLLPAGVTAFTGEFHPGDVVEVRSESDELIGRGIINYTSWQLKAASGLSTTEVEKRLELQRMEVIHRDEWITLV